MTDDEIDLTDPDAQELDDSFFTRATIEIPKPKELISLRVDGDVLAWFKAQGKGYQTKIAALMRAYMLDQMRKAKA